MSSSGSSFTSSSLGRPPTYSRSYVSPVDSTWTPTSGVSIASAPSSIGGSFVPRSSLRPLDIGPPGFQATIQYHDPSDMERYVTFTEPHRVRYISDEGICIHDQYISVRYEFTSVDGSFLFQGDVRRKDLVDFYDVDVVWTNIHGRTDSYGKVKGIGAIQRLKLWRDRYTTCHSLTVLANKTGGSYREYDVHTFEGELRGREDRAKQVRLVVHGRRGSAPESSRRSLAQRMRPRVFSAGQSADAGDVDIRYLSIQFTHGEGYRRFLETWLYAHSSDREFNGVPFPPHHFELPSPQILPGQESDASHRQLGSVPERPDG
ncbi:hypothetical protein PWT90_02112 [Aphanocladium album]|nr:hypothetical protein PWT90_02112 [Aphanocladium album]